MTKAIVERRELLTEIRQRLLKAHGQRLRGVVLYGSEVRGEARPDSDIDLLVLLDGPIDYSRDLRTNINALYDLTQLPFRLATILFIAKHPLRS